ncbi:MAG: hypothetical protein LUD84_01100 [Clostridiales bacterium]|nr:hypothetical protein [Clostridiales bacterium]
MGQLQIKRKQAPPVAPVTERAVRSQLAWAAGAESFQNRDPLYHVTESFQQTFDAMGRRHAAQLAEQDGTQAALGNPRRLTAPEEQLSGTDSSGFYQRSGPGEQAMLQRFSEVAFQRGTLSGAVLRGTGQMMLFSCLKKTVGQSEPKMWQQRKLFEKASPHRNLPGAAPRKVAFNRGFTDSAVGLVVDTLRDARQTVDDLTLLAQGRSDMGAKGADTLLAMYPFLDDSRERALLENYRAQLAGLDESAPQRSILQNAVARTQALIDKKAQMKLEFTNRLRFLSDRATEALEVFGQPGFASALDTALRDVLAEEAPDAGEGDGHGTAGANDSQGGGSPDGGTARQPGKPMAESVPAMGGAGDFGGQPDREPSAGDAGGAGGPGGQQRHADPAVHEGEGT